MRFRRAVTTGALAAAAALGATAGPALAAPARAGRTDALAALRAAAAAGTLSLPLRRTADPAALRLASSARYTDTVGDAGAAADVTEVDVVDDASRTIVAGTVFGNRTCPQAGDFLALFLDTDGNAATGGTLGDEVAIAIDGTSNAIGAFRWNGTAYEPASLPTLAGACITSGSTPFTGVSFAAADAGAGASFDFTVASTLTTGAKDADLAPNGPPSFRYVLTGQTPATPPAGTPGPARTSGSTAHKESAARLPSRTRYDGTRSIKNTTLGRAIYRTMKETVSRPRLLAIACWTSDDFASVLAAEGIAQDTGGAHTVGVWFGRQPRWLHLADEICVQIQRLVDSGAANGQRAGALVVAMHETLHAYGIHDEAQTNCYAVQLAPAAAGYLGVPKARIPYLGSLGLRFTRRYAPDGYWDDERCRDGGAWDLFSDRRNLR